MTDTTPAPSPFNVSSFDRQDWLFGAYLRNLMELQHPDLFDDDPGLGHLAGLRAGIVFGATTVVQLLDDDAHTDLVERLKIVFADEIAILAEHNA